MFKNPFSFQGRITRTEYALGIIITMAYLFIVGIFDLIDEHGTGIFKLFSPIGLYFAFCQNSKRCHDLGNSWWYQFFPFYGLLMFFAPGEAFGNKYGRNSKAKKMASYNQSFEMFEKFGRILLTLDKERSRIFGKLVLIRIISIVLFFMTCFIFIAIPVRLGGVFYSEVLELPMFCTMLVFFIIFHVGHQKRMERYHIRFKKNIITPLINLVDKSFLYKATVNIKTKRNLLKELVNSEILAAIPDVADGSVENYIFGTIGATKIKFFEFSNYYGFNGYFFSVASNKSFSGKTFVLPDIAQKKFGLIGQELQSVLGEEKKLIRLENEEFEELFVVYSDDQIEARYLLSPSLMEKIVKFQNSCFGRIHISFVKNKLYIAISSEITLFEPKLHTSIVDFNEIQEHYNSFTWIADLAKELNFNRRIWKKG